MTCAWNELLAILPYRLRCEVERYETDLQELRMRIGREAEFVAGCGVFYGAGEVSRDEIDFVLNVASRYSLWTEETVKEGYLTAQGGHRIGICGEAVKAEDRIRTFREVTSVNIRVARDCDGIGRELQELRDLLILGPPGCGKTTLLRAVTRQMAEKKTVCVVDERGELFPRGFETGKRMDVIRGCRKSEGIGIALRVMGPQIIAVDEVTDRQDCEALLSALWCGVGVIATAHAASLEDLMNRPIYRPLTESGIFRWVAVLDSDKHYTVERMDKGC